MTLFDMTLIVRSRGTYIERLCVHYLEHSSINSHGFCVLRVFFILWKTVRSSRTAIASPEPLQVDLALWLLGIYI